MKDIYTFHTIYIYTHHIFSVHSSVDGHLGCSHVLATVNSAAVNTGVHVSLQIRVFVLSGYMPSNGIAGWDIFYGGRRPCSEWRFSVTIDVCAVNGCGIKSQMQFCHLSV